MKHDPRESIQVWRTPGIQEKGKTLHQDTSASASRMELNATHLQPTPQLLAALCFASGLAIVSHSFSMARSKFRLERSIPV
eukprot:1332335-Amphidinium_carterae.1